MDKDKFTTFIRFCYLAVFAAFISPWATSEDFRPSRVFRQKPKPFNCRQWTHDVWCSIALQGCRWLL